MWQPLSQICLLPSGCTWPCHLASGERSFSPLKLIKTYFRSSIQPERLNSLDIMSTEFEISRGLKIDKILKDFADVKAQKKVSLANALFIVDYNSPKQSCGAGTQISCSIIQNLLAPATKCFGPLKTKKHCLWHNCIIKLS